MEDIETKDLFENITEIKENVNYWLVRTMGGDYYKHYVKCNYIAIGYNEITEQYLKTLPENDNLAKLQIQETLKFHNEEMRNVSYPASQLLRFAREIKVGDVVIVPSSSSNVVTFGIVESEIYEETGNLFSTYDCPFSKRRKIKWVKDSTRQSLPAVLQLMFNSRHIISSMNSYSNHIDSLLNDFYSKDDKTYIVLRVRQSQDLRASDFGIVPGLIELLEDFRDEYGYEIDIDGIKAKISVQSIGAIVLFTKCALALTAIGLIIFLLKGGEYHLKLKELELKMKSENSGDSIAKILLALDKFLTNSKKRKLITNLTSGLNNMEIESQKEVIKMTKKIFDSIEEDDTDSCSPT